jgi:MFS family permease
MPSSQDIDRRFSGWRIVALATITLGLTGPGQTIGVSVFIDHFTTDLDLEKSWVTAGYLVGTLCGSLAMPTIGRWVDRYGVRRAMFTIASAFSVALVAMAGVQGIVSLTAGFVFIRMLGQGALSLVSTVSISLWFEARRGTAISVAVTISAALMALVPFALDFVIGEIGWRGAWLVAAGAVALIVLPIAWFGMIDRPSDVGQFVDGIAPANGDDSEAEVWGVDRATALRRYEFWVLAGASAAISSLVTALNFHQITLLGESGFTSGEAAALFLPQMIGSSIGSPAMGIALDRLGTRFAPAIQMMLLAATLVVAGTATSTVAVIGYAILLGLTAGASRSLTGVLAPRWFGTRHLGAIQGSLTFVAVMASASGPFAFSLTEIMTGGYRSTAVLWGLAPAVFAVVLALRPPKALRSARAPGPLTPRG